MPNAVAYAALIGWPLVVFLICRALPPAKALLVTIIGGFLLLPTGAGFDFPLLPVLNKDSISALSFLLFVRFSRRELPATRLALVAAREQRQSRTERSAASHPGGGGRWIEITLIALVVTSPILSVIQNGEPVVYGATFISGLTYYDALSMIQGAVLVLLPYLFARRFLRSQEGQLLLLKAIVISGLFYSVPALIEIRLSPQMSQWVYGFLPQSFAQAIRGFGYRPVVFLPHGLWLAIFFAMTVVAALTVWRELRLGKWLIAATWLFIILFLSNSLGAFVIAIAVAPAVLFLKPGSQLLFAGVIALIVLLYPALRGAELIPVADVARVAKSISEERAGSLTFRLENEDALLSRANQKPLAGWGGWGRNRIYDSAGEDISITDGVWIIVIGTTGWLGYIGQFGLLTMPIVLLAWQRKRRPQSPTVAGLSLVLCVNLVDLVPNAALGPITWLVAGAVMGAVRAPLTSQIAPSSAVSTPRRLAGTRERPSFGRGTSI